MPNICDLSLCNCLCRDKEQREEMIREELDIQRRRNMTDEERAREDAMLGKNKYMIYFSLKKKQ